MNAIVNITSQAFVRSQRRFEPTCYVQHPFGTPCTCGIGLPRHQEHSFIGIIGCRQRELKWTDSWDILTEGDSNYFCFIT